MPLLFTEGYREDMLLFPCSMVVVTTLKASRAHSEVLKLVADSTAQDCERVFHTWKALGVGSNFLSRDVRYRFRHCRVPAWPETAAMEEHRSGCIS